MRKSLVAWSIACAMLATGTVARAEMAAPAPAPSAPPAYGETINLEQAKKLAAAAFAEAKKNNWFMAISVVGPAGDLVYFGEHLDLTQLKVWDGTAWIDANLNWLEVKPVGPAG